MATRFVTERKSNNAAINDLADRAEMYTAAATANATTTSVAMTAAQAVAGLYVNEANGALTVTLPTPAALFAAIPNAQVGSQVVLFLRNDGNNTVTLSVSGVTGATLDGTATIATGLAQVIVFKITAAATYTAFVVLKVAN